MSETNDGMFTFRTRPTDWFCQEFEGNVYRAPSYVDTYSVRVSAETKSILEYVNHKQGVSMLQLTTMAQAYTATKLRYEIDIPWSEVKENVNSSGKEAVTQGMNPSMKTQTYEPSRPAMDTKVNTYLDKNLNEYRNQFKTLTGNGTAEAVRIGIYYAMWCYNAESYHDKTVWGEWNRDVANYIQILKDLVGEVTDDG